MRTILEPRAYQRTNSPQGVRGTHALLVLATDGTTSTIEEAHITDEELDSLHFLARGNLLI